MARGHLKARRNANGTTSYVAKFRTADGTQVKRTYRTKRDAQQALNCALVAVDRGELRTLSSQTFSEAADDWLERKRSRIEASTYRGYEIELRLRLKPAFGSLRLRQVTRSRIEHHLAALAAEGRLSRKTINDSLIPLRQILGVAVRDGVIASNPAVSSDRDAPLELPYEPPTMLFLNREDARRYLSACRDWYRPLAEVLVGAGLRIGEAVALEWRDVDRDGSALEVRRTAKHGGVGTPKGDRVRTVLVAPYLLELLREQRSRQAADGRLSKLVFPSGRAAMLDRHYVLRCGHQHAVKSAALSPALRLHDLRHTAASLWLAAGESIFFVQQQLGHADIQTTIGLYGHPDKAAHRQAAERAAEWWREGVSG